MLSSTLIRLTTSSLLFKRTLIDPNPPLVGQAIEIKEYLRENTIPFDESWTSIKALCCRSSNRLSGLIHIEKQTGLEEKKERERTNKCFCCSGDFACSKCSTTGNWNQFQTQWQHFKSR